MNKKLKIIVRFFTIAICGILGLIVLLLVKQEVSMISHSFIEEEFNRMGLYEDLPDFPKYKISRFWHSWSRSRYDYTLTLSSPICSTSIMKIDSLCNTYEGQKRWHHDEDKGLYTIFLWDIAKDYNDFLLIIPGNRKVKFVFEPYSRIKTKDSDDLFYGPIFI